MQFAWPLRNEPLRPTRRSKGRYAIWPRSAPELARYGSLNHRSPGMFKTIICAALLAISIGGCTQAPVSSYSHSPLPKSGSPEYLDVIEIIVQVCLPSKWVAYSNEEIWLSSVPKVDSIAVQRARNGIKDDRTESSAIDCIGGESGNRDMARRWIPFPDPDRRYPNGLAKFHIQFGGVRLENDLYSAGCWARTQRAIAEQHYRSVVGTPLRELIHYVPRFNHDLPPC